MAAKPILIKKMAILVAIEATVGTFVLPVAADSMLVSDVTLTPIEGDEVEEGVIKPFFGASESVLVTLYRKIAFSVGFAGVGTAGDIPGYATLLRACAASATNTPAPDPNANTVFAPVTDDIESVSIYAVVDKQAYKMAGARGNCKVSASAKQIPKYQFEFTGGFFPVQAVPTMPAVNYTKFQTPLGVNKLNTTLSLDGVESAASDFQLDFGNVVVKQDLMSVDATEITDRKSMFTITARNTDVGVQDWIAMGRAGAKVPLLLKHGQGVTNTVSIAAPLVQIGKPTFSDQDGVQMVQIPGRAIPSDAGNDEWTITV